MHHCGPAPAGCWRDACLGSTGTCALPRCGWRFTCPSATLPAACRLPIPLDCTMRTKRPHRSACRYLRSRCRSPATPATCDACLLPLHCSCYAAPLTACTYIPAALPIAAPACLLPSYWACFPGCRAFPTTTPPPAIFMGYRTACLPLPPARTIYRACRRSAFLGLQVPQYLVPAHLLIPPVAFGPHC